MKTPKFQFDLNDLLILTLLIHIHEIIDIVLENVYMFASQHVCRARMGRAVRSVASVLGARPATTSQGSAAVLQDSWETAVNRVSMMPLIC